MYILTPPYFGVPLSYPFPKSNLDPKTPSLTTSTLTFLEAQSPCYFYQRFANFSANQNYPESLQKHRLLGPNLKHSGDLGWCWRFCILSSQAMLLLLCPGPQSEKLSIEVPCVLHLLVNVSGLETSFPVLLLKSSYVYVLSGACILST